MFKVYCDCKSTILKVVRKVVKVVDVVLKGETRYSKPNPLYNQAIGDQFFMWH